MQLVNALVCICGLLGLGFSGAWAADNRAQKQRLCQEGDLRGTYKLVDMHETPKSVESALYHDLPYQYLAFYSDHAYAYVTANKEIKTPPEVYKAMLPPQKNPHVLKYALDAQGVLDLYTDKNITYRYRCQFVEQSQSTWKKGDLVLTGYTRENTQLYKLYRRWF